jgi:hypothetical protein
VVFRLIDATSNCGGDCVTTGVAAANIRTSRWVKRMSVSLRLLDTSAFTTPLPPTSDGESDDREQTHAVHRQFDEVQPRWW